MNPSLLNRCESYLLASGASKISRSSSPDALRSVTISRETGAGAISVGELLVEYLESKRAGDPERPWAVFDRQLAKKIVQDHKLSESVANYLQEDVQNPLSDLVEDVLGLHPSASVLVEHTNRSILRLALAGNVVIVGRGSNIVTADLPHVFHVRLIAPLDFRIRHIAYYYNLSMHDAANRVKKSDLAKARYVRRNFSAGVQDLFRYHLIINTGQTGFEEAARIIGDAVIHKHGHPVNSAGLTEKNELAMSTA